MNSKTAWIGNDYLWISSSADTLHWSPPRAIYGSIGSRSWMHTPDGQVRFTTLDFGTTVPSADQIARLDLFDLHTISNRANADGITTCAPDGRFYTLFNDSSLNPPGLWFSSSPDGIYWPDHVPLLNGSFISPKLFCVDTRALLLAHTFNDGAWGSFLRTATLPAPPAATRPARADPLLLGDPLQLTSSPASWFRANNDLVGFVSGTAPFLLCAPISQFLPPKNASPSPPGSHEP